ncbi:UDP-N-acetylenolpyruvoylglucosamine reductase [Clostridia bacterium]|nr:UDP-N-acetylenolpyruvoylglucosamine reductase [Clostridia bacterium]
MNIRKNVPLDEYTTFRIGGDADLFAEPQSVEELREVYAGADGPVLIIGNGSNLLVSDAGFQGLAIHTAALSDVYVGGGTIIAQCGAKLSKLANTAFHDGMGGLEFAQGIPGTVGGAVFMNAGAYGGEIAQTLQSTTYMDKKGELHTLSAAEHDFSYRHSVFYEHPDWVIVESTFKLKHCDEEEIRQRMEGFAARRRATQPLLQPSAGSVFKRPEGEGHFAGQLIEEAGLKGYRVGGAEVSAKHAGFIINSGGATFDDVKSLIAVIQKTVRSTAGVWLEPEIRIIGE